MLKSRQFIAMLCVVVAMFCVVGCHKKLGGHKKSGIDWSTVQSVSGSPSPVYSIQDIGPGEAVGINNTSQVVGITQFHRVPHQWSSFHGFLWQSGQKTEFGTLGGVYSGASKINLQGEVLGSSAIPQFDKRGWPISHPCLWEKGHITDLMAIPGYKITDSIGFNHRGQLFLQGHKAGQRPSEHLLEYVQGKIVDRGVLGTDILHACAVNDQYQVVGNMKIGKEDKFGKTLFFVNHAFLWKKGKVTDLGTLGGAESTAASINDQGEIVGDSWLNRSNYHAFLYEHGKMRDLGTLATDALEKEIFDSHAYAINNNGQIVGFSSAHPHNLLDGFIWENGKMMDINTLIPAASGWYSIGGAEAINGLHP